MQMTIVQQLKNTLYTCRVGEVWVRCASGVGKVCLILIITPAYLMLEKNFEILSRHCFKLKKFLIFSKS